MTNRSRQLGALATLVLAPGAHAQFGVPDTTSVRERYVGDLVSGTTSIVPEGGDQIGAFASDGIAGVFEFEGDTPGTEFNILVSGDDPETEEDEGPGVGERITFRYFDASTGNEVELTPLNEGGEEITVRFEGQFIPPIPIDLPGFDLTPTRSIDLRPGSPSGGGSGGDGDGDDLERYDVNGDGRVDERDVAAVLSIYIRGGSSDDSEGAPADVNEDGQVNTADAIVIMRNK